MSRLSDRLQALAESDRKALVTFITAGDPTLDATVPALHSLVAGGADVLELGVPFSDPEAEGPVIQASSERGLSQGTTLPKVLEMVRDFRATDPDTPVVLMGYLNSVLAMGIEKFADAAGAAGVDGLIMVNLPPEEAHEIKPLLDARGIDLVFLVAPTTTAERAAYIVNNASGFIYYVSLKGITGADHLQVESVAENVQSLKAITRIPVLVGFGIKDAAAARAVARYADGVVIGSALVTTMAEAAACPETIPERLTAQIGEIRAALDT
ncbi:MAG: tryptophan synthase subunit alpha [Gammaproteobacteria bacterium]|nr:tryptophan synthase subunit alpha [Gammaproteobacteria bacterium]